MLSQVLLENRKARFNYFIEETKEVGMVLVGTEVKSLKAKRAAFNDAFVTITPQEEAFLEKLHISLYTHGTHANHIPERKRKLLLSKRELRVLRRQVLQKGVTLVPLNIFLRKGWLKMTIGIAKGKKQHDKRQVIKQKDQKRSLERELKYSLR